MANQEDRDNSQWAGLTFGQRGPVFNCLIYLFIYFGPVFIHGTEWVFCVCCYCCPWAVSTGSSWQTQPDVTLQCCSPAPRSCRMENKKSKGGAEKARVKKRKALETDAARCAKIGSFFKTSMRSETTNDEMLNKMQLYLHVVTLSAAGSEVGSRFSLRKREPTPNRASSGGERRATAAAAPPAAARPSPASHPGPTEPGVNPYPEVTYLTCRLPLPPLFHHARGWSPWRPAADMGTTWRCNI